MKSSTWREIEAVRRVLEEIDRSVCKVVLR